MNSAARCLPGIALGLAAAIALPLAAVGQSPEPLPEWLEPDLPPGVDQLCGGPVVPDLPFGEPWPAVSAVTELPPLPAWCDGTCVVDIAFIYDNDVIGRKVGDVDPDNPNPDEPYGQQSVGELRRNIDEAINANNVVWRRAGLDAELRFVGLELDPGLDGLTMVKAIGRASDRLPEIRRRYGADLLYALSGKNDPIACGLGRVRSRGVHADFAATYYATGVIWTNCLGPGFVLAHEVGHNLGLIHNPENRGSIIPYVPFGHGYSGLLSRRAAGGWKYLDTIMGTRGSRGASFSTPDLLYGRVIGNAEVSDSTRALRYTIPDATRYSPTVVPEEREDPHGYGCRPSGGRACLNERRFRVRANYSTSTVSRGPATRLETLGLGDSGSLFYFFDSTNPELLVKVVNGCWLNDHWWVFGSAATDLEYSIAIDDLATDGPPKTNEYRHQGVGVVVGPDGYSTGSGVINDTRAFPCTPGLVHDQENTFAPPYVPFGHGHRESSLSYRTSMGVAGAPDLEHFPTPDLLHGRAIGDAKASESARALRSSIPDATRHAPTVVLEAQDDPEDFGCLDSTYNACFNNWRFSVSARYSTPTVKNGPAHGLETFGLGNSASVFYFFDSTNPELLVKVVNGCWLNDHWWVFGSAATDLDYRIEVGDMATADAKGRPTKTNVYTHRGGGVIVGDNGYSTGSGVINDTSAFPCNP